MGKASTTHGEEAGPADVGVQRGQHGAALGSWGICVSQLGPCPLILAETHCWTSPDHGGEAGRKGLDKGHLLGVASSQVGV